MAKPVRVRVSFTVEVDPDDWALNYGTSPDPSEVRADVSRYLEYAARGQLAAVGVLAQRESS